MWCVVREARMSVDDARPFDSIEFCTERMRYDTQTQGHCAAYAGGPYVAIKTINATMIRKVIHRIDTTGSPFLLTAKPRGRETRWCRV